MVRSTEKAFEELAVVIGAEVTHDGKPADPIPWSLHSEIVKTL
jgi:hypothetical protein